MPHHQYQAGSVTRSAVDSGLPLNSARTIARPASDPPTLSVIVVDVSAILAWNAERAFSLCHSCPLVRCREQPRPPHPSILGTENTETGDKKPPPTTREADHRREPQPKDTEASPTETLQTRPTAVKAEPDRADSRAGDGKTPASNNSRPELNSGLGAKPGPETSAWRPNSHARARLTTAGG
jgi:hypothetical protein